MEPREGFRAAGRPAAIPLFSLASESTRVKAQSGPGAGAAGLSLYRRPVRPVRPLTYANCPPGFNLKLSVPPHGSLLQTVTRYADEKFSEQIL